MNELEVENLSFSMTLSADPTERERRGWDGGHGTIDTAILQSTVRCSVDRCSIYTEVRGLQKYLVEGRP